MARVATPAEVVARRCARRDTLLDEARAFADALDPALDVRAAVVYGSVARGDFHTWSDVDVLVIASRLPEDYRDRLAAIGWPVPGRVEPLVWTPGEYLRQHRRRNPIVVEVERDGVRLRGGLPLTPQEPPPAP
jgi:predicted nucleotidyltransferase